MSLRPPRPAAPAVLVGAALLMLTACAPAADEAVPDTSEAPATSSPTPSNIPTFSRAPSEVRLPADCKAMLSADVLSQLGTVPLNDPASGASGVQPDGSLICIWRDPGADTTGLTTTISRMNRGPALDLLNDLVATQGFSCYTPDAGTRCEKTWINETYPVNDGRTLYWRDDVLIDTQYSNLAPTGYTASIISSIFG